MQCAKQEAKVNRERKPIRLNRLCGVIGSPFPFIQKGKRMYKKEKKVIRETSSVNHIPKVTERRIWRGEKISRELERRRFCGIYATTCQARYKLPMWNTTRR